MTWRRRTTEVPPTASRPESCHRVVLVGNGAHLTGAPRSLLALLQCRPTGVRARVVLIGGGPLVEAYRDAADQVTVISAPKTRAAFSMSLVRRMFEEIRLSFAMFLVVMPRMIRAHALVVNTVEYEAPLAVAVAVRRRAAVIVRESPKYVTGARGCLRRLLLRVLRPNGVACVSRAQAEGLSQVLNRQVLWLPNVVLRSRPVPEQATHPRIVRFLVVGSGPKKGVDLAHEAIRRIRASFTAELVVVGSASGLAEEEDVTVVPIVRDLVECIEDYGDVLLGVSRSETFGRVPVEAALAGIPTIAWDLGGYRETVPKLGGWLITPFDVDALAAAMRSAAASLGNFEMPRHARAEAAQRLFGTAAAEAWWEWILRQAATTESQGA